MVQISDENCKPFWSMLSRRVRKIPFSSSQFSIHDDSLLQNVTDIISKCDSYFITKCDRSLFQPFMTKSFSALNLLCYKMQNATKCDSYYKMWRLLQIAKVHSFTYLFKFTYKCFARLALHNSIHDNSYERY